MKVVTVAISDAQEGQELAEDLFVDGCKLLSKGRKLTIQIIKILKNRKIEFLQIGCQGTASPGVADPMEIGLAVWPGQGPGEDWEAVWLGKAH